MVIFRASLIITLLIGATIPASAESETELESLTVTASRFTALDQGLEEVAAELAITPGATSLALPSQQTRLSTLQDALDYQPGILIQAFSGGNDQPRLNIRGSGIQSTPLSRGILLRQNGLPINEADGSFIIGLLEARDSWAITAHHGANSRALGPATLGGDINFLTATGREQRFLVRLEDGGFGRRGGQLAWGHVSDQWDARLSVTGDDYAGYRHHSQSRRYSVNANGGWRSKHFETRLSVQQVDLFFELPFALDAERAKNSPRSVVGDDDPFWPSPQEALPGLLENLTDILGGQTTPQSTLMETLLNVYRRNPRRDSRQQRIASRTILGSPSHNLSLGMYLQQTDDRFVDPLSHAVSDPQTYGLQAAWNRRLHRFDFQLGLAAARTRINRNYFENNAGQQGDQYADLRLEAAHLMGDFQWAWHLAKHWSLSGQWQYARGIRNADERINSEALDQSWVYHYPKIGLIHQRGTNRWFINYSESRELPSFWEIASNKIAPLPLTQARVALNSLQAQTGRSYEVGGAGQVGKWLNWKLSAYRTDLEDELLSTASSSGLIDDTVNYAGGTLHQGVELGLGGHWSAAAWRSRFRMAWTFSDFTFKEGEFAGRRIAGVARHLLQARWLWGWKAFELGPTLTWSPSHNPVDHSNTAYQDPYTLWGAQMEFQPSDRWRIYLLAENLANTTYASAYVIRSEADTTLPTYFPGNGRSINGGLIYHF